MRGMGIPDVYGCTEVFVVAVVLWAIICAELLGDHGITVVTTIVLSLGTAKLWSMFGWLTVVVPLLFTGLVFVGFLVVRLRNNRTQYERGVRARLVKTILVGMVLASVAPNMGYPYLATQGEDAKLRQKGGIYGTFQRPDR
jgi:hypothetical protein